MTGRIRCRTRPRCAFDYSFSSSRVQQGLVYSSENNRWCTVHQRWISCIVFLLLFVNGQIMLRIFGPLVDLEDNDLLSKELSVYRRTSRDRISTMHFTFENSLRTLARLLAISRTIHIMPNIPGPLTFGVEFEFLIVTMGSRVADPLENSGYTKIQRAASLHPCYGIMTVYWSSKGRTDRDEKFRTYGLWRNASLTSSQSSTSRHIRGSGRQGTAGASSVTPTSTRYVLSCRLLMRSA